MITVKNIRQYRGVVISGGEIGVFLNGTNTRAAIVGASANKNELLLLIKFRAGGFFPFSKFNQNELVDFSLDLSCADKTLEYEIKNGIETD